MDECAFRAGDNPRRGDWPAQAPAPVLRPQQGLALGQGHVDEFARAQGDTFVHDVTRGAANADGGRPVAVRVQ